ncbi:hypothetical protein [Lentibacillus sediminis]|uniref:hypothetical protein n=1 Tax=Lentibacillus sediminis TaxID=1940529 RepID=UPI000C1B9904|nr:hypothetical protein [Lentibacillus sediminis]
MKKFLIICVVAASLLTGCYEGENNKEYSTLLADEDGRYGLYIVTEDEEDAFTTESLLEHGIRPPIIEKTLIQPPEDPKLEVDEYPTYMVFDTENKIFETTSKEEVIDFILEKQEE